jgi:hypothetical protein
MLQYKAEQALPPNTISYFIVQHNREIQIKGQKHMVWRYGVVLQGDDDTIALVREEDRVISVSVKGSDKTNYISELRGTLEDIFDRYKSEKPELRSRITRFGQLPDEAEESNPLWLADRQIMNHLSRQKDYYDDTTGIDIPMEAAVTNYNIKTAGAVLVGDHGQLSSTINTFNFHDCNIDLQGSMNELADLLVVGGNQEEANVLQHAAVALEKAEGSTDKEEVKKKGAANQLKRLVNEFEDKDSTLHKTIKGVKNGVNIAQEIAKKYNDMAQWLGWPTVPKPFLKKDSSE